MGVIMTLNKGVRYFLIPMWKPGKHFDAGFYPVSKKMISTTKILAGGSLISNGRTVQNENP
jgi:hypothetical protein